MFLLFSLLVFRGGRVAEAKAGDGGSIVRVDKGGSLRVGPQSAGATPGPACYALGGEQPTLTDANVALGYLNPDHLAGGTLKLAPEKAHQALHDKIAVLLKMSVPEVAYGVYRIAVANMARAARAVSVERGRDPRNFALCAFGGNGPLHAAELAQSLGMKRILIPPSPGLFSAFGLLFAEVAYHSVQTYKRTLTQLNPDDLVETLHRMEVAVRKELATQGEGTAHTVLQRAVDLRYVGQSFELTLPLANEDVRDAAINSRQFATTLAERFAAEHERVYGHLAPDDPIEVVNLRVTVLIPSSKSQISDAESPVTHPEFSTGSRRCYFGTEIGWLDVPVLSRDMLASEPQSGPLIIEEYDATILVPQGYTVTQDECGNAVVEIR